MTGRELIEWIQENKAEDLPIIFYHGGYEGDDVEADNPEIEHIREDAVFIERHLRGKDVVRLN